MHQHAVLVIDRGQYSKKHPTRCRLGGLSIAFGGVDNQSQVLDCDSYPRDWQCMQVATLTSWSQNKDVSGAEKQLPNDIEQPIAVLTGTVAGQAPARTGAPSLGDWL